MKRGQKGFGAVEGLLIVIILLLVGFIGYYVYHTRNNTNSIYNNTAASSNQNASKSSASDTFIFKEIGIQMTLTADLKGLTYRAETIKSVSGGNEVALYLSDTAHAADMEKCYGQKADSLEFGAIGKTQGQYPSDPTPQNADGGLLKQFSDFYVSASYPNGITTCSEPGVDPGLVQTDAHALLDSFSSAFQNSATIVK